MSHFSKLLLLLLPAALVSCSVREAGTVPGAVAPTIRVPTETPPADLGEATKINNALRESNRQLDTLIAEGKETRYELNRRMTSLIAQKSASEDELILLQSSIRRQQTLIDQGKDIIADQSELIDLQAEQLMEADKRISNGEMEKIELRGTIAQAELDLKAAHEVAQQIAVEREHAKLDAAEADGKIAQITKVALRRLWWALAATLTIVIAVLSKIYRVIHRPII